MSSILTNNGAMTALQTLKSINKDMAGVQNQISTGKQINSAKDNAAVWAISKVMEADVTGFKAISDSLTLGESTVAVAKNASESVTDLLTQIKGKIVQSQESNVDRGKIQQDISALREQITSVVSSAQFNGLNLVDGSSSDDVKILSSLDRSANGDVASAHISVVRQDLSLSNNSVDQDFGTANVNSLGLVTGVTEGTPSTVTDGNSLELTIAAAADGNSYSITLDDTGGENSLGTRSFEYVANDKDSQTSIAANLNAQISKFFASTGETNYSISRTDNKLTITNNNGNGSGLDVQVDTADGGTAGTTKGGLGALVDLDVTTADGAATALTSIETMIQTSIDAAAAFGSSQNRIEIQNDFVGKLMDSMKSGIGAMVDADMEETSARLQALQVQQQLGVQSLSMANQAPQSLLSLFR